MFLVTTFFYDSFYFRQANITCHDTNDFIRSPISDGKGIGHCIGARCCCILIRLCHHYLTWMFRCQKIPRPDPRVVIHRYHGFFSAVMTAISHTEINALNIIKGIVIRQYQVQNPFFILSTGHGFNNQCLLRKGCNDGPVVGIELSHTRGDHVHGIFDDTLIIILIVIDSAKK